MSYFVLSHTPRTTMIGFFSIFIVLGCTCQWSRKLYGNGHKQCVSTFSETTVLNLGRGRPDRLVEWQLHAHYPMGPLIIEPTWMFFSSVEFYLVRICCLSFMLQKPKLQRTWQLCLIWKPHHLLFYPLPLILQGQKITVLNDPPWIPKLKAKASK